MIIDGGNIRWIDLVPGDMVVAYHRSDVFMLVVNIIDDQHTWGKQSVRRSIVVYRNFSDIISTFVIDNVHIEVSDNSTIKHDSWGFVIRKDLDEKAM